MEQQGACWVFFSFVTNLYLNSYLPRWPTLWSMLRYFKTKKQVCMKPAVPQMLHLIDFGIPHFLQFSLEEITMLHRHVFTVAQNGKTHTDSQRGPFAFLHWSCSHRRFSNMLGKRGVRRGVFSWLRSASSLLEATKSLNPTHWSFKSLITHINDPEGKASLILIITLTTLKKETSLGLSK